MKNLETLAALAKELPEEVKANAEALVELMGTTIEGISDKPKVWYPGYLKIVQGTSDRSKLPKGTGIGAMILGDELKEAPLEVIPIRAYEVRTMWNPDPENARILCTSPDSKAGLLSPSCRSCQHSIDRKSTRL